MVGQTERDSKSSIKDNLNPLYKKRKSKFESLKGTDTKVCTKVGFRWKHFVVPTMVGTTKSTHFLYPNLNDLKKPEQPQ